MLLQFKKLLPLALRSASLLEATNPALGFVGNWLRHSNPFPFADFVTGALTSRRGLVGASLTKAAISVVNTEKCEAWPL